MTNRSLSSVAEEYLYSINPLAQRIGEDVTATKEAYEGLWNALSTAEKNQAIDETIIQPEVALKYTHLKNVECSKDLPDCYPKLRIHTGLKYVIDETGSVRKIHPFDMSEVQIDTTKNKLFIYHFLTFKIFPKFAFETFNPLKFNRIFSHCVLADPTMAGRALWSILVSDSVTDEFESL